MSCTVLDSYDESVLPHPVVGNVPCHTFFPLSVNHFIYIQVTFKQHSIWKPKNSFFLITTVLSILVLWMILPHKLGFWCWLVATFILFVYIILYHLHLEALRWVFNMYMCSTLQTSYILFLIWAFYLCHQSHQLDVESAQNKDVSSWTVSIRASR